MTERTHESSKELDAFCAVTLAISMACALVLVFLFYVPGAGQALKAAQVSPGQGGWLYLHIAAYSISYILFGAALLLAGVRLVAKARTRRPWVEAAAGVAALLTIFGFVFGILASKPMWGAYWIWDAKLILSAGTTVALVVILLASMLTMRISSVESRNLILALLLIFAVLLCSGLYLFGRTYGLTIHPQWFPELLFR